MKKLKCSLAAKTAAIFLLALSVAAALGGVFCTAYMVNEGYYKPSGLTFYDTSLCDSITRNYADTVYYDYLRRDTK